MTDEEKVFDKIPNNFFYDNNIRKDRKWRSALLVYFLFTSRKNMNNDVYISYKEINDIFHFNKVIYKAKPIIVDLLELLQEYNLVSLSDSYKDKNNNSAIKFKWIKQFPNYGGKGWIKFYADDFEIHSKIGNIPYMVMWILRMYRNHETDSSFLSISDITSILECDRNKVQNSIKLFEKYGLFEVTTGEYYYNDSLEKYIRKNNEYKYTGIIDEVISADQVDIDEILFPKNDLIDKL